MTTTAVLTTTTGTHAPTTTGTHRDRTLDLLRAGSLLVVVLWHWVFTVPSWRPDGPHAGNPIGSTPGAWAATWVLQVMPTFFFVGGYVHHRGWSRGRAAGTPDHRFVTSRLARLLGPTAVLVGLAAAARVVLAVAIPGTPWVDRGLVLLLSPLWFLGVYLLLVTVTPRLARAHERAPRLALVGLGVGAVAVDWLRFAHAVPFVEWANFLFVYGFAHQLGFWWERLLTGGRRVATGLTLVGLAGLAALTTVGTYPRSMVGVPGDAYSNVAPPTVCLVALALVQVGVVLGARRRLSAWLAAGGLAGAVDWANRNAMAVFLWHFTGYALFAGLAVLAGLRIPEEPTAAWWAQRPLWLVGPALCTLPLLRAARRLGA